ncbi:hypothetical protein DFH09DRAFT_1139897 [Mycena vulgaris]|nr:hypothetical protein DFH09DRAFT_1139897 [Mycena vulgaris]
MEADSCSVKIGFSRPHLRHLTMGSLFSLLVDNNRHTAHHDGVVHHPLGAGSYIFQKNLIKHLTSYCTKSHITFHIGAQPNSSPHMGTLVNFTVAFALAQRIRDDKTGNARDVLISLDIVDTAPSEQITVDGIKYQRSQRHTGEMKRYMGDFIRVLEQLQSYTDVPWRIRTQAECFGQPAAVQAVAAVIARRAELARSFSPDTGCLGIRAACPMEGCGLADKHGINNVYDGTFIKFQCPHHGAHTVDASTVEGVSLLEFNTPVRNILRAMIFAEDQTTDWIRVTGADYAGYYQEQVLWRHIASTPLLVFYSPLILDWSGAKLSKSLYVREAAYEYLTREGLDYLVSYEKFKEQGKDLRVLYDEVKDWVDHPFKLFRSYSLYYINDLYRK